MTASGQLKNYLDVAYRRKWWIVVPVVLSAVACYFVLDYLPKTYRASTTILVTPQRMPEDFVRSTVTTRVEDRMSSMSVQILSRSFLEQVAREVGLVPEGAAEPAVEQACSRLKGRVELAAGRTLSYFEVAVEDEIPARAAQVANRLASLFIEQNSQMRSEQASGTRSTVEGWLDKKKVEIDAMEAQIASYKRGHLWELSDQLNANLQLLEANQQRIAILNRDIRDRQDRLTDARARARVESTSTGPSPESVDPAVRKLAALEAELAQLRVQYTDENPIVRRKTYEIAEFRKLHPGVDQPSPSAPTLAAGGSRNAEVDRLEREIVSLEVERDRIQSEVNVLSGRINATPLRDQELKNLTRGYDALKKEYDDLLQKREMASRAEELESSKKSEQFRVQDPARVPTTPYKPNPLQVLGICLVAGLGLGAAAAFVLEFLDQSLKTEDDFRRAFPDLPLLSAVPHVETTTVPQRRPGRTSRNSGGKRAALLLSLVGSIAASPWAERLIDWTRR